MLKLEKPKRAEELGKLIDEHPVVAVLDMHKLPARQLQSIREALRSKATIRMEKKSIMERAVKASGKKNVQALLDYMDGEPAMLLSDESPFRLFRLIKEARSPAPAKINDIAPSDIVIPKGSTNLPPGPAISALQKIGLKTTMQGGKIAIAQDKVAAKVGEKMGEDLVSVLNLLKLEPMEIGLNLVVAWEDGVLYGKELLDIDVGWYISELQKCVSEAVNLSVNTGYPTAFTVELMLQKAFSEARSLCVEAQILEKDFIDGVLLKAIRGAQHIQRLVE